MHRLFRHRLAVALGLIITALGIRWGAGAAIAEVVVALPAIAWRYDNRSGAFFPLALLTSVAMLVLVALLSLMALALRG